MDEPGTTRHAHALRDREESERLRQLGGLLVHDLNNVLFALLGRVQLLERKATDPATAKSAREILETVRLLEAQIVRLHAACRRDEPATERANARAALARALAEASLTLPPSLVPRDAAAQVAALPGDLAFDGDPEQVATAVRQLVSIHRPRACAAISASVRLLAGDPLRIEVALEDDGGRPAAAPSMPSLLSDGFSLDGLPLATAYRATRDFGGEARCEATAGGLRTVLSFAVDRGLTIAQFDARGEEREPESCGHEDECVPPARRVLVADDDPSVRAVLVAALEAVGDEVDTLADPGACDTHAELDRFDVVILDAGGGGLEALGRIRRRGVEVPVLVASGDRVERPGDPFTRCAMKPIPLETLDRELASLAALRARD